MIILPKVNQSQPSTRSLSGSHLTEGLTALVNAAGGIEPINLAHRNRTAIQGTVDFSVVESKTTWRVRQQAADGAVTAPTTSNATNLSFLIQYHPLSLAATSQGRGVVQWAGVSLNTGGPRILLNQTTTGDLRVFWGGGYRFTWTGGAVVGKTQTVLVTISGNDVVMYANGAFINSLSNAPQNGATRLYFGNAFPQSFDGHFTMGAAWERTLSPDEALALTANPWQLYQPQRKLFPVDIISGTTNDLLADNLQSTSSVSTPTLGQTHVLLADDLQSTSSVSTPTVGQVHVLLADNLQSASSVSTPSVGVIRNLLADNLESVSTVSTPTVVITLNALLANDLQSVSTLSIPVLRQKKQINYAASATIGSLSAITFYHNSGKWYGY
jgi:hypothetical protein